jgi:hypothetical protein
METRPAGRGGGRERARRVELGEGSGFAGIFVTRTARAGRAGLPCSRGASLPSRCAGGAGGGAPLPSRCAGGAGGGASLPSRCAGGAGGGAHASLAVRVVALGALSIAVAVVPRGVSAQSEEVPAAGGDQAAPAEADAVGDVATGGDVAAEPEPEAGEAEAAPTEAPAPVDGEAVGEGVSEDDPTAPPAQGARARECSAQDVMRGLCTAEQAAASSLAKPWRIMARIDYQQPIVLDHDPENDIQLFYYLGGEVDIPLLRGLYSTAWLGLSQRFWTVEGESAVDFIDPFVGIGYRHSAPLRDVGLPDHSINFVHRLSAYLPLSRESRANLYYTTLDWITAMRFVVGHGFMVGVDLRAQYRFHEYAEQNGVAVLDAHESSGGMNTRLRLEAGLLLQQSIFDEADIGTLQVQGSIGVRGLLRYQSQSVVLDAEGAPIGQRSPWSPDWYWTVGVSYTPIEYVSLSLSLEHGYSDLIRGGVQQAVGFDRDETKLVFSVFGRY